MGNILVRLEDDIEQWVRIEMVKEYGARRGALSGFVNKVLRERMEMQKC